MVFPTPLLGLGSSRPEGSNHNGSTTRGRVRAPKPPADRTLKGGQKVGCEMIADRQMVRPRSDGGWNMNLAGS